MQYRNYVLLSLSVAYCFNAIDRVIVSVLTEPIKMEFGLTDAHLGFLCGFAFGVCNALAGIPFGLAVDRLNRSKLLAVSLAIWSTATFMCGLANSLYQLLLARLLVGVAEAGALPASISLIGDYFKAGRRATAVSMFYMAAPVGAFVAFAAGGFTADRYGWRAALQVVGLPGILVALAVLLTVREPVRGMSDAATKEGSPPPPLEALRFILSQRSLVHIVAGCTLLNMVSSGVSTWITSLFVRAHSLDVGVAASSLAVAGIPLGLLGTASGGWLVDRLAHYDERWRVWVPGIAAVISAPLLASFALAANSTSALILYGSYSFFSFIYLGTTFGLMQNLVTSQMRGIATATIYFFGTLIGFGCGPQIVGIASDLLKVFRPQSLGPALAGLSVVCVWAAIHYQSATRTLREDISRVANINLRR